MVEVEFGKEIKTALPFVTLSVFFYHLPVLRRRLHRPSSKPYQSSQETRDKTLNAVSGAFCPHAGTEVVARDGL
ncbi:hypothetical protein BaRGS_00039515 [Batillaria attramentaria]|uniref:Uncharacterized protein n=1 Tax=Batillaria attramentaria TaxID=370345 RepID=A0ABD0J2S0_9CAEN